jgi:hypothetical protein
MAVEIKAGSILHWERFQFPDGTSKNKYIVILGCKPGCNWLVAVATSQKKNKEYTMGCHDGASYYHIPGGGRDFFGKDTWLVLAECREVSEPEARRHLASGTLALKGCLRAEIMKAIHECVRQSEDIPGGHLKLL